MNKHILFLSFFFALPALADGKNAINQVHDNIASGVDKTAEHINNWLGETEAQTPASASLRVMLDTHWNKDDGVAFKPRIRGRIKLPVLEEKISVVFGDERLDTEFSNHLDAEPYTHNDKNKQFDYAQSRDENADLALRWSQLFKQLDIKTDTDIGIRSGSDLYLRLRAEKKWQHNTQLSSRAEQTYRYGIKSKHHFRSEYELRWQENQNRFINNEIGIEFNHNDGENNWTWDNHLYRQHYYSGSRSLNYGLYTAGGLNHQKHQLNSYGPFISWRQPVGYHWLFTQAELNYLNNKDEHRNHRLGAFLRIEALF